MNKIAKITIISAIAGVTGLAAINANAYWDGQGRGGYCDQGRMQNQKSMQFKGNRQFGGRQQKDLNLSADQAKTLMQARLIMRGNDRLKVGKVTEKDDTSYLVQIVTVDDSLVREVEIDRNTGRPVGKGRQ